MTLLEILKGEKSYDSSWAIYAQKVDGKFAPESPARFGQRIFENGGMSDEYDFFSTNESAVDSMSDYYGSFELQENLTGEDERFLKACWVEENGDSQGVPSIQDLCDWAEEVREEIEDLDVKIEEIHDRWSDSLDTEEAALQLIEKINESL